MGIVISEDHYTVSGNVTNSGSRRLAGFTVDLFDKDLVTQDDFLGKAITNGKGEFSISFSKADFKELVFDANPDLYFKVYDGEQEIQSKDSILKNAKSSDESITISINTGPSAVKSIQGLMQVESTQRDMEWLENALHNAVELELATLPPYAGAKFSITGNDPDGVAGIINSVYVEEMLHMGIALNCLVGLDLTPPLNPNIVAPEYPGPLPGNVHPGLMVGLEGLNKDYVNDVFRQIEWPDYLPNPQNPNAGSEEFPTIGAFYEAIIDTYKMLQPAITSKRQLTSNFSNGQSLKVMATIAEVEAGLNTIIEQGEGTTTDPDESPESDVLAHFFLFSEVYFGNKYVSGDNKALGPYTGAAVAFPDAHQFNVPKGGYDRNGLDPNLVKALDAFNTTFTTLLGQLQSAWENGDSSSLSSAIGTMYSLSSQATAIMGYSVPGGNGEVYGPEWRTN